MLGCGLTDECHVRSSKSKRAQTYQHDSFLSIFILVSRPVQKLVIGPLFLHIDETCGSPESFVPRLISLHPTNPKLIWSVLKSRQFQLLESLSACEGALAIRSLKESQLSPPPSSSESLETRNPKSLFEELGSRSLSFSLHR